MTSLKTSLSHEYRRFLQAIESLDPDQRDQSGVSGAWSVRDVVSHLIGWDQAFVLFLFDPEGFDPEPLYDIDGFNARSVSERRNRSWEEIISELQFTYADITQALDRLTTDLKVYPRASSWLEGRIKDYQFHTRQLENWIQPH